MSEKLKNELQKRLDAVNIDRASLRDAKNARELLALLADERGKVRSDSAAALEQLRQEGVALAAYEQGIRMAAGEDYAYDGQIGQDEVDALARLAKVRFEGEAVVADPSVGSISARPYLRSESDIASTNESLAGFLGGLDRSKWSREAVEFLERALVLLSGKPDKKSVQAMQREVANDFPAEYRKRKDDGDLGAATRLAIFRRMMRFSFQASASAHAPAASIEATPAKHPLLAGLTDAYWEEHASDTIQTAAYRAMALYVESCGTDRSKLESALAAIDGELRGGRAKNPYLPQAMRGIRETIVKILENISNGKLTASDKPLDAIPAGSVLSGLHGIVWESDASDTAIVGAERAMHAWIDAYKAHPVKLREAYALLEREIRSGRAKNQLMRGAMGSAKGRIAEILADPSKAAEKPFIIPAPLPVPPPPKIAVGKIPAQKPVSTPAPAQAPAPQPTLDEPMGGSKGWSPTPPPHGLGRTKGFGGSPSRAPEPPANPDAPTDAPTPAITGGLDARVAGALADMPPRETLDQSAAEPLLRQLEEYLNGFEKDRASHKKAKNYLDGILRSYTIPYMQQHILAILEREIPKHTNAASQKAMREARDELLKKLGRSE